MTPPLGLTADQDINALLPLAGLAICDQCDGLGLIFDHSSPDPQQRDERTCWACRETGLVDASELDEYENERGI